MRTLNASALPRIVACLGSVAASEGVTRNRVQSDDAREGDAAHWVAQRIAEGVKYDMTAPNGVPITAEMIEHGEAYASYIPDGEGDTWPPMIETRADWLALADLMIQVRGDAAWFNWSTGDLHVIDYKYGWRIVEPEMNWQLIADAIGVVRRASAGGLAESPQRVHMCVYQPRPFHPDGPMRTWTVTLDELVALHDTLVATLAKLPSDELATGDHCRYCPVGEAGACPAYLRATQNAIDVAMCGGAIDVPLASVGRELAVLDRAAAVLKQRQEWLQAQAVEAIKADPQALPGWALETQYGHTTWTIDVAGLKQLTNADVEQPAKLITPAEAKRRGVSEDVIKANTKRPVTGQKLVRRDADAHVRKKLGKGKT